eukprot:m.275838 g.275838  ORF g.275838 m.275838 type:complete len:99 (+) comp16296_c1_seq1:414-710(+)
MRLNEEEHKSGQLLRVSMTNLARSQTYTVLGLLCLKSSLVSICFSTWRRRQGRQQWNIKRSLHNFKWMKTMSLIPEGKQELVWRKRRETCSQRRLQHE